MADSGWRPKQKVLTPEEVLEKAKKDLAPFWIHSAPLVAPVPSPNGGFTLFPFSPEFDEKLWLIGMIDVCSYSSSRTLTFLREMHKRYAPYSLGFLALFWSSDRVSSLNPLVERAMKVLDPQFPAVLDPELMLAQALGLNLENNLLLRSKRKTIKVSSLQNTQKFEEILQDSLRIVSPGLPLPLYLESSSLPPMEIASYHFHAAEIPILEKGNWVKEAHRWTTKDPNATLEFKCEGSLFGIVARAMNESVASNARIAIELQGKWVREEFFDEKLFLDEEGRTLIRVSEPMLYPVLKGIRDHQSQVVLKFIEADQIPVEVLSVRFANSNLSNDHR